MGILFFISPSGRERTRTIKSKLPVAAWSPPLDGGESAIFAGGENANESLPAYPAHRAAKERIATSLRSTQ